MPVYFGMMYYNSQCNLCDALIKTTLPLEQLILWRLTREGGRRGGGERAAHWARKRSREDAELCVDYNCCAFAPPFSVESTPGDQHPFHAESAPGHLLSVSARPSTPLLRCISAKPSTTPPHEHLVIVTLSAFSQRRGLNT